MKDLTWDDLLALREKIVGKDIEYESSGMIYRGPIKTFLLDEKNAVFAFEWLAYRWPIGDARKWYCDKRDSRQYKDHLLVLGLADSKAQDCEDGRIVFSPPANWYVARYFLLLLEENLSLSEVIVL